MKAPAVSVEVPRRDRVSDEGGIISRVWENFFRAIQKALDPLGTEKSFELSNNVAVAADVEGLSFDKATVSQAAVDYLIQRVTTGGGAVEQIETGTFFVVFKPTSNSWALSSGPTTAGITLTITATGQIRYTSTNIAGSASISKLTFRSRTLASKNSQYSEMGQ